MKYISIWLFYFFITVACKSSENPQRPSECISSKIEEIKNEPVRNPPAEVWKWQDEKYIYFYITSDCCDQFNYLYDENCEVLCAPSGGFTGKGDLKCPKFSEDIERSLVWKDDRK